MYVPPVKHNIAYCVAEKPSGGIPEAFGSVIKRIKEDKDIGIIIIFCRTYEAATSLIELGEYYIKKWDHQIMCSTE